MLCTLVSLAVVYSNQPTKSVLIRCDIFIDEAETPVFFDIRSNKTLDIKGTKTVKVQTTGSEKRHVTLVLTVTASGEMLPPMVIFKGKRALKLDVPTGFVEAVQEKGWMDQELMKVYSNEIEKPYTKRRKSIMILDSFRAHVADHVKDAFRKANSLVVIIRIYISSSHWILQLTDPTRIYVVVVGKPTF